MKLSDIAGSQTISKEDWERVVKAFEPKNERIRKKEKDS
jgi:hypothetical protein